MTVKSRSRALRGESTGEGTRPTGFSVLKARSRKVGRAAGRRSEIRRRLRLWRDKSEVYPPKAGSEFEIRSSGVGDVGLYPL